MTGDMTLSEKSVIAIYVSGFSGGYTSAIGQHLSDAEAALVSATVAGAMMRKLDADPLVRADILESIRQNKSLFTKLEADL